MGRRKKLHVVRKPTEDAKPKIVAAHAEKAGSTRDSFVYRQDPVPKGLRWYARRPPRETSRGAANSLLQALKREDSAWPGPSSCCVLVPTFNANCQVTHKKTLWKLVASYNFQRPFPGGTVLFHGTSPTGALGILTRGFDITAGRNVFKLVGGGGLLGPGVYLAPDFHKSLNFSLQDFKQEHYMLAVSLSPKCRVRHVTTGDLFRGIRSTGGIVTERKGGSTTSFSFRSYAGGGNRLSSNARWLSANEAIPGHSLDTPANEPDPGCAGKRGWVMPSVDLNPTGFIPGPDTDCASKRGWVMSSVGRNQAGSRLGAGGRIGNLPVTSPGSPPGKPTAANSS